MDASGTDKHMREVYAGMLSNRLAGRPTWKAMEVTTVFRPRIAAEFDASLLEE